MDQENKNTSYQCQNEKGDITIDSTAIKGIITAYQEHLYASKFSDLEKWKNSLNGKTNETLSNGVEMLQSLK